MAKKTGLGKGLDALFQDNEAADDVKTIRLNEIEPNKNQPRKDFDEAALAMLADSIRQHGLIQPILVRPTASGHYQIVAGERRWRASRMLGLTEVPVIIKELDDRKTIEIALIENLQREDLNPIEESRGYKELMVAHEFTQEQVAESVGKSRPAIANSLRLLTLPQEVIEMVENGALNFGQAKAVLAFEGEKEQKEVARMAVKKGLTVRQLEGMSKKNPSRVKNKNQILTRDSYFDEIEIALNNQMRRKVRVESNKQDKGTLHIDFYSKEELADIAKKLSE